MCIFCKIVEGEIPSAKVYEDDDFLAILDLSQTTKGHTLIMPKKHYENILEMPEELLGKMIILAQKLAKDIITSLGAKGFNLLVNTSPEAGQTIMHAHMHIIPRYSEDDTVKFEFTENKTDLNEVLKQISIS